MTTLQALRNASANQPWMTLFNRESMFTRAARFQVAWAESDGSTVTIALLAFVLEAQSDLTQVLFFKFATNSVHFRHKSGTVSVELGRLRATRDAIAAKVSAFTSSYIETLPDL
ncbi:hypothetical protein [Azospirillum sp. TSO35-2]|uniref:hypothetical protein n=1 Tax=Azospirillum sp. TSO35-2 TaxID=716796 RepID=UPI000D6114EB|nr:hypothetical protein [Azospirillum sp. TSO35-2]PWC39511.1 hypothetical protein TSO352_05050 [Azospirillum sp. TSO35-2]